MAGKTGIEWTDATWNPIRGCSRVSEGCRNCYAEKVAGRFSGTGLPYEGLIAKGGQWNGQIKLVPELLDQPLRWQKPRRIFVNSMSDLFHENVPFDFVDGVFDVMASCPQHTFQILTKRPERMLAYMSDGGRPHRFNGNDRFLPSCLNSFGDSVKWPLPNVWLGVSVEDQKTADERIPLLLQTPAAVRWISAEPLLGAIDLDWNLYRLGGASLDWVVVGGESGKNARPMHPDWARSLRDQCKAAGVPFLFKQWGEWVPQDGVVDGLSIDDNPEISRFNHCDWDGDRWVEPYRPMWCDELDGDTVARVGKKKAGRHLDGVMHDEYPEKAGV